MATSQLPSMQPRVGSTGSDLSETIVQASPTKESQADRIPHESKRLASKAPAPEVDPALQRAADEDAERALEDNNVDQQEGELVERQEFKVSRLNICDQVIPYFESKSEGCYQAKMGNQKVLKMKADKENLNPSGETKLDVWVGAWEQKTPQFKGIIVTNRNACRNFAAGDCKRKKCHFYHAAPGDLVDNLVSGYQVLDGRPPSDLLLDRKAKGYFWTDEDNKKIEEIQQKVLVEFEKKLKAMHRVGPKTLEQKMDELRRKYESQGANGDPLVEEVEDQDDSQDEEAEGVLPVKRERIGKRERSASEGKRLHKDKKRRMISKHQQ